MCYPVVFKVCFAGILRDSRGKVSPSMGTGLAPFPFGAVLSFLLYNLASDMILPDDGVPVLKIMYKNLDAIIICFSEVPIKWFK